MQPALHVHGEQVHAALPQPPSRPQVQPGPQEQGEHVQSGFWQAVDDEVLMRP